MTATKTNLSSLISSLNHKRLLPISLCKRGQNGPCARLPLVKTNTKRLASELQLILRRGEKLSLGTRGLRNHCVQDFKLSGEAASGSGHG